MLLVLFTLCLIWPKAVLGLEGIYIAEKRFNSYRRHRTIKLVIQGDTCYYRASTLCLCDYIREIPNSDLGGEGCQILLLKEVTCRLKPVRRTEVSKQQLLNIIVLTSLSYSWFCWKSSHCLTVNSSTPNVSSLETTFLALILPVGNVNWSLVLLPSLNASILHSIILLICF